MARGILSQSQLTALTLTVLYTVPSNSYNQQVAGAFIDQIFVTNTDAVAHKFRISLAINGAGDTISQYIAYDLGIAANAYISIPCGFTLQVGDEIRGYVDDNHVVMSVYGSESL